jgi:fatty-acyl-CoA synthase
MRGQLIEQTASAYRYPLLIKELLKSGVTRAPAQEIVHGNARRMAYRELDERVGRLASGLAGFGVGPGDTVGVMDWDSTRYLECYFAVPMMGAVLHTINVRLSPEQILYTINHAEDDVILVNAEFLRCWARSGSEWSTAKSWCC